MVSQKDILLLRNRMLELMDFINGVCKKYDIYYSLSYGTLIGAIRHKGFIPWDDDFDIMMDRKNYEKFLEIVEKELPKKYFIRNRRSDRTFKQTFTKLMDKNSEFINDDFVEKEENNGVFIDVFPIDKSPNGFGNRVKLLTKSFVYKLLTKAPNKEKGFIKLLSNICNKVERYLEKTYISESEKLKDNFYYFSPITLEDIRFKYNSNIFDGYIFVPYEDREYMVIKEYDSFLTETFGDYMIQIGRASCRERV